MEWSLITHVEASSRVDEHRPFDMQNPGLSLRQRILSIAGRDNYRSRAVTQTKTIP